MFPAWCPSCPRAAGTVRAGALSAGPAGLDRHGNAVCSVTRRTPAGTSKKCSSMRTSPVRRPCVRTGASRSFFRRNAREKAVSGAHLSHHRCRHGDGVVLQTEWHCRCRADCPPDAASRGAWKLKFTRSIRRLSRTAGLRSSRARRLCFK